jgi:uncharacterized protein (TIGR03437 family)
VVTTANGSSAAVNVNLQQYSPGLFMFSSKYPAAVLADGTYLGSAGLLGSSTVTRPGVAGDVIQLFGTGFGPTDPGVPSQQVFNGAAPTASPVSATIGGVPAAIQFAGITGAGLYQVNVVVPSGLTSGDQPLVLNVGGVSTQDSAYVTLQ